MALRQHVEQTGKRDGFEAPGELATMATGDMASQQPEDVPVESPQAEQFDMDTLIAEAEELAGSRMTMREQVVNAIANQMTFEDLSPATQAKVQSVRAAADPKAQVKQVASALLSQWRQQREVTAA